MINMDKRRREILDTYWLEIMFFLIGEHADQHAYQVRSVKLWVNQMPHEYHNM